MLVANALAIATLLTVWLRGGRHAGFVLIAWVPMEIVSTARAVQLSAGMPLSPWLEYGLPVLLAFAAVVLVLGLADRMLVLRLERDAELHDADLDALTGVSSRRAILRELESAVATARDNEQPLWILFLDLDHFKGINDNHGHAVGDACLLGVTSVIRANVLDHRVGRLGGEEFLVLLPGCNRRQARDIAERIRVAVEADCTCIDSAEVRLTVSAGMVEFLARDDAVRLMARAIKRCTSQANRPQPDRGAGGELIGLINAGSSRCRRL